MIRESGINETVMKSKQLVAGLAFAAPPNPDPSNFSARPPSLGPLRAPSSTTAAGAAPLQSHARAAHWEPKFPFDLVVTYEDEATRARALALCHHLVRELQNDHDMRQSWWKFSLLYDPRLLEHATESALTANMIIMSLNNGKELPFIARTWIEGWLRQKNGHDSALVALVDNTPSARCADCPMLRYLNGVAHKARMDFFPHVFAAAPLLAGRPFPDTSAHGSLEDIFRRPNNPHPWGINEH